MLLSGKMKIGIVFLWLTAMIAVGHADVPRLVNVQGLLTDSSDEPIADGTHSVTFAIYNVSSGGIALWTETRTVTTEDGLFTIVLGETTLLADSVFANPELWLGITVSGDTEMTPRQQLTSTPYGYRALDADTAGIALSVADGAIELDDLAQNGAAPDQIIKWNGNAWSVADDEGGSSSSGGGWSDDGRIVRLTAGEDSVGVGTSTPSAKLHVVGDVMIVGNTTFGTGHSNTGNYATITGGNGNIASSDYSVIGGGEGNYVDGFQSVVGGGFHNSASGHISAVLGGSENTASSHFATVGGGTLDSASAFCSTVGGGSQNKAREQFATIGGGRQNEVDGYSSVIAGGEGNYTKGIWSTVGGGLLNHATAKSSTVCGGMNNYCRGYSSVIVGGGDWYNFSDSNAVHGDYSIIGAGKRNYISSNYAVIPGGRNNIAQGDYSLAAGYRAQANHVGSFVWADGTDADFASTGNNQFLIRASGGVGIGTTSPQSGYQLHVNGLSWFDIGGGSIALSTPGGWPGLIMFSPGNYRRDMILNDDGMHIVTSNSSSSPSTANGITILNNGSVGIGETNPVYPLDVDGDIGCTALHETSDVRLKENIQQLENSLAKLEHIRGVSFEWNTLAGTAGAKPGEKQIGVVAQEVEDVFPELVSSPEDGYKSVDYSKLTAVLIEAVKELKAENEVLKERIDILEESRTR